MQVSELNAQLGVGSGLVGSYRDAMSVLDGHLLTDLSPPTDHRLRYSTSTGYNLSKIYNPERLKQLTSFEDEHTRTFYSPSVPTILPQRQKSIPSVLSKSFYPVSLRIHSKSARRKPARIKRHHRAKFQNEVQLLCLKRSTCKQRGEILASEKDLQLIEAFALTVINHFSWHGAGCPRSFFSVQQKFEYPVSYKAGTSKVSTFAKSHVPNWFT